MWRRDRDWAPRMDPVPPELQTWADALDVTAVSDRTARLCDKYLRTYRWTNWFARREGAARLMSVLDREVSPPPPLSANPLDVFATVLTKRGRH